jgi:hypothetical protein
MHITDDTNMFWTRKTTMFTDDTNHVHTRHIQISRTQDKFRSDSSTSLQLKDQLIKDSSTSLQLKDSTSSDLISQQNLQEVLKLNSRTRCTVKIETSCTVQPQNSPKQGAVLLHRPLVFLHLPLGPLK